jgi:hypothetical protein
MRETCKRKKRREKEKRKIGNYNMKSMQMAREYMGKMD